MSGNSELKKVRFDKFCEKCSYWNNGAVDPIHCDDCLEEPMREGTYVPLNWKEK